MSNNDNIHQDPSGDPYRPYDPFNYNSFSFLSHMSSSSAVYSSHLSLPAPDHHHSSFDPTANNASYNLMSYTDSLHGSMDHYNTLSRAFDISCASSSDVVSPQLPDPSTAAAPAAAAASTNHVDSAKEAAAAAATHGPAGVGDQSAGTSENPSTANSSISCSSNEGAAGAAGGEEDSGKSKKSEDDSKRGTTKGHQSIDEQDHDQDKPSKKVTKAKKKEKRPREPRFAFLTKSEIDHLEDGYRWRKYGQKAVKNSPYPRSYYRCTTQKCTVKKRVERSFQDPAIVITTYEGQHNHHCPATLRGSAAAMLSPSLFASTAASMGPTLPHEFFTQFLPLNNHHHHHHHHHNNNHINHHNHHQGEPSSVLYSNLAHQYRQQLQVPDFGLLQDLVPPFSRHKQDP